MQESLFEDGKDPQAFRTIGEVAAALDIKPHVLRYWEEQFPMLRPVKRSGGRRYYRPADITLLQTIDRLLNHDGYTIRGAVKAIEDGAGREAVMTADKSPLPLADDQPSPPMAPAPVTSELVERLRGAVRTLEASTGELPTLSDEAQRAANMPLLRARLRALRQRLASALDV